MIQAVNGLLLIFLMGWLWRNEAQPWKSILPWAVSAKVVAGLALGWVYFSFYEKNDTELFFENASTFSRQAIEHPMAYLKAMFRQEEGYFLGEHRTWFFVKVTSVFVLLTGGSYWLTSVYFSLISFLGSWYLVKQLTAWMPELMISALVSFLFFPSCVFWSAGVTKESLAMAALFAIVAEVVRYVRQQSPGFGQMMILLTAVVVLWKLKYFYLAVLAPVALATVVIYRARPLRDLDWWKQAIVIMGLSIMLAAGAGLFHPNLRFSKVLHVVTENHNDVLGRSEPADAVHFKAVKPHVGSIAANAPLAVFSTYFRPMVWEGSHVLVMPAALENLLLLFMTLWALRKLPEALKGPHRIGFMGCLLYVMTLGVLISLSSPNFGSLVRFKIGALPFLVVLVADVPVIRKFFARAGWG
jgi:hypothetical protein